MRCGAVGREIGLGAAFDVEDDAGGGLRVLGVVLVEQSEGVGGARAVEFAAVPHRAAGGEGGVHGGDGGGGWLRGGAPG